MQGQAKAWGPLQAEQPEVAMEEASWPWPCTHSAPTVWDRHSWALPPPRQVPKAVSSLHQQEENGLPLRVTHCQPQNAISLASHPGHTLRTAGIWFFPPENWFFLVGSLKYYKACGSPPIPWWRLLESPTLWSTNTEQVRRSV